MTLEERVEALEMGVANMIAQQSDIREMKEIVNSVTLEKVANASRPGGILNAVQKQTAEYSLNLGIVKNAVISDEMSS